MVADGPDRLRAKNGGVMDGDPLEWPGVGGSMSSGLAYGGLAP
jgi:hypothetical protein